MKYVAFYIWILFAGLLLGASIEAKYKRCGHAVKLDVELVASSLAWPLLLIASVIASAESVDNSECNP
jgi:hypothetical protein